MQEYGFELNELSPEEEMRWLEALSGVQSNWVEEKSKIGLPADELLKKAKSLDKKYSELYGS